MDTREQHLHAIRALETTYNGVTYRSRTEARWAVFFDQLGLNFLYEQQGYAVDGWAYLPDFLLLETTTPTLYAEVKPYIGADPEGEQKLRALIAGRQKERGLILPDLRPGDVLITVVGPDGRGEIWEDDRGTWLCCPGFCHYDVQPVPQIGCADCGDDRNYWYESNSIRNAYTVARSYRFEMPKRET